MNFESRYYMVRWDIYYKFYCIEKRIFGIIFNVMRWKPFPKYHVWCCPHCETPDGPHQFPTIREGDTSYMRDIFRCETCGRQFYRSELKRHSFWIRFKEWRGWK